MSPCICCKPCKLSEYINMHSRMFKVRSSTSLFLLTLPPRQRGGVLHGLEPWLHALVLLVERCEVQHQVLDHEHVRQQCHH
jgi:hypothetical protein